MPSAPRKTPHLATGSNIAGSGVSSEKVTFAIFTTDGMRTLLLMEQSAAPASPTLVTPTSWKLPQTNRHPLNNLPGDNTRRYLKEAFTLAPGQTELWNVLPHPVIESLPTTEAKRKGFQQTSHTVVAVWAKHGRKDFMHANRAWVPAEDAIDRVNEYRQNLLRAALTLLPDPTDLATTKPH